jgi:hypothetical protein
MNCTNPACRKPLGVDHVTLVTTAHVRRFCSVECIEPSRKAHDLALFNDAYLSAKRGESIEDAIARFGRGELLER